jgi:hypothetical protein
MNLLGLINMISTIILPSFKNGRLGLNFGDRILALVKEEFNKEVLSSFWSCWYWICLEC